MLDFFETILHHIVCLIAHVHVIQEIIECELLGALWDRVRFERNNNRVELTLNNH